MVASGCGKWEMTIWIFNSRRINLSVKNLKSVPTKYVQGLAYGLRHQYQQKAKVLKWNFSIMDI